MVKLYNRRPDGIHYWDAWKLGAWVVIHEGKVGTRGSRRSQAVTMARPAAGVIAEFAEWPRGNGYAEISLEKQYQIVLQYRLKVWGSVEDLDRGHEIENLFNECLGWTGNGFCDGNEIGSGSLSIFSIVVEPRLAVETMVEELDKYGMLDGAVIAMRYGEEYRVFYPQNFEGEFTLI